ncbi:1-phosphofructokinase [Azospirillum lipoferum]|uniref:Phosphofructokinase n=1 Tax=Azospirillum lipoferum TaxID=193 RepID=A0A5A9GIY8_AZOLI|nr:MULTISPECIES: 1-phosphofructokinase [Azospirillum]KAA0594410.1 1-phosphofructokinase [Azospirillum lipoferum]MCP1613150.1 1-phosphofructokinase [Azospirillum lipoferum]MDW5531350.1 1-phosphofructokinase [Azospirillum sp. NL1]
MTNPVVTVTLNPAIDQTITVEALKPGSVHRAKAVRHNAGGKGVNVASCLADWGVPVVATGLLGTTNAAPFEALFQGKGIADAFLRLSGETRVNIKIADLSANDTTDINLPGLSADESALDRVQEAVRRLIGPGTPVLLAGSLPEGLPVDAYGTLTADFASAGARVVLDSSGAPLAAALASTGALPHCIKPNRHELEDWAGRPLPTNADLLDAARQLRQRGVSVVVVSLGADGALFVDGTRALHGRLPPVQALSTVGAGDAMVAGLIAAFQQDGGLEDVARLSVAFAAAKLGCFGPNLPDPAAVRSLASQVVLTRLADRT